MRSFISSANLAIACTLDEMLFMYSKNKVVAICPVQEK